MKHLIPKTMTAVPVLALALAVGGCGGSSSSDDMVTEPPAPMPDPAIAQRADVSMKITAASTAVHAVNDDSTDAVVKAADDAIAAAKKAVMDATAVPAAEMAAYNGRIGELETTLMNAKASRTAAMDAVDDATKMAMKAAGKALKGALGSNPLGHLDITTNTGGAALTAAGLVVDQTQGTLAADPAAVTLSAGDSAGSLGAWSGTNYAHTNRGTKVSNSAVVYTNRAAPKTYPIATRYATAANVPASGGTYAAGTGGKGTLSLVADTADSNIKADMFPTAGAKTFTATAPATEVLVPGTYHGASGTYRCTPANDGTGCTATVTATGISLSDSWNFAHGAGAMVSVADANYLFFGWWLTKDKDDMPTAASAFTGTAGTAPAALTGVNAIVGSATYSGHAAGKFAINDPLGGGDAGHFTADANLTAKFSGGGAGITGTIDNFMANDKSVPWSVALNNRTFATGATEAVPTPGNNIGADGAITSPDNTTVTPNADDSKTTVWSIDGNAAAASGTWSGQMYDEAQGADTDGSDVPTTVLGRFQSMFGSTHTMVGAFGATKE